MVIHHLNNHRPIMYTQRGCNESSVNLNSIVLLSVSAVGDGANGDVCSSVFSQVIVTVQYCDCPERLHLLQALCLDGAMADPVLDLGAKW